MDEEDEYDDEDDREIIIQCWNAECTENTSPEDMIVNYNMKAGRIIFGQTPQSVYQYHHFFSSYVCIL